MAPSCRSILIVGSGVFGLSTAHALSHELLSDSKNQSGNAKITLISPGAASSGPTPLSASVDSSRIVRSDYADPDYAALGLDALRGWADWKSRSAELDGVKISGVVYQGLVSSSSSPAETQKNSSGGIAGGDLALPVNDDAVESGNTDADKRYLELAIANKSSNEKIEILDENCIKQLMEEKGPGGHWKGNGYVNWDAGWVNAGQAITTLWNEVRHEGIVDLQDGTVKKILYTEDGSQAKGVELEDGGVLFADLIVVAAGAWTAALVDLGGQAAARGQCMGYVSLSPSEAQRLAGMPVVFDLKTGVFVIPPTTDDMLKIARHDYGYRHPIELKGDNRTVDLPVMREVPDEAEEVLRTKMDELVPWLGMRNGREWKGTRMCWYSDTPSGDFLIDYHPSKKSLFIATGDSGHGFKFLPVLGRRIVAQINGEEHSLAKKWRWRTDLAAGEDVWCEDGSRLGEKGRTV